MTILDDEAVQALLDGTYEMPQVEHVVPVPDVLPEPAVLAEPRADGKPVCIDPSCSTILSRYNDTDRCGVHAEPDFNASSHLPRIRRSPNQ